MSVALGWLWVAHVLWWGWSTRPAAPVVAFRRRLAIDTRQARIAGAVAAGVAAALVVSPIAGPLVTAVVWLLLARRHRAQGQIDGAAVADGLAEVVDLFGLAVSAGRTVPAAVEAVGRRADGVVAAALGQVAHEIALGRRCADALEELPGLLGEQVRPLVAALVASERYGAPLGDGLDRLAADVRADRRRRAEERARRVPVKLLFPLVCCVLPAFALLTVAPLLAGSFGSLRL
ncbi:MAG: type II secretion system F family protein [Acidobacteria bacterium]|nr:type II secretion system F family protein [Acidobacteriota bacterium]